MTIDRTKYETNQEQIITDFGILRLQKRSISKITSSLVCTKHTIIYIFYFQKCHKTFKQLFVHQFNVLPSNKIVAV